MKRDLASHRSPSLRNSKPARRRRLTNAPLSALAAERLELRVLLAADAGLAATTVAPWQNVSKPTDVDGDGFVTSSDVLAIFNELNRYGARKLEAAPPAALRSLSPLDAGSSIASAFGTLAMIDVDGDGFVTSSDALMVFNDLNAVDPLVIIRAETTDLLGNPISTAIVGDSYLLSVYVEDPNATASSGSVFSAFMDISYESAFTTVNGPIVFGSNYPNDHSGNTATPGFIDDVGGTAGGGRLGPGEFLLFSVPFVASAEGTVNFSTLFANNLPARRILLLDGELTGVPPADVSYGTVSLDIILVPELSVSDVTVVETNSNTVAVFDVTLSNPSSQTVTVDITTEDITALAGLDYQAKSEVLTFLPGVMTAQFSVVINGDTLDEIDETFRALLSSATNATIADGEGIATILDDDGPPSITIDDTSVIEGNLGTVNAQFDVSLSAPSGKVITVNFATSNGTATSGSDYEQTTGSVTFLPGEMSKQVVVRVIGDTVDEPNEKFIVTLTNPLNVTLEDDTAEGTIIDDDLPEIRIGDATVTEGDAGTTTMQFTVTLSSAGVGPISVAYTTVPLTATAGLDYQTITDTLVFTPGQLQRVISVLVVGDTIREPNETFEVRLSNAVGAVIVDDRGLGTILDNDPIPTITIEGVSAAEGNSGTSPLTFNVRLSNPSSTPVTVQFATQGGSATSGVDFQANSGLVTFAPGQVLRTVVVNVIGDTRDEFDESLSVALSSASGGSIGVAQATGTIIDDDAPPIVSINDVSQLEGNFGATDAVFTVALSAPSDKTVTVNFSTFDITAQVGSDYFPANGTLTFTPGVTVRTISVPVFGDEVPEQNETFGVQLSAANNATIGKGTGQGVILNDDAPLSSISGYVYVDNLTVNGRRDGGEAPIAGVAVVLAGTNDRGQAVNRTAVTDPNGFYRFADLRPGQYSVQEIQPAFFRDGAEELGTLNGTMQNDRFGVTLGSDAHGANYNFGELGLRSNFIGKRLFLTSTQPGNILGGSFQVDSRGGDLWFSFNGGWSGLLSFLATPTSGGSATLALYDNNLTLLASSAPGPGNTAQINWNGTLGQPYFLKVGGNSISTLQLVQGAGFASPQSAGSATSSAAATSQAWAGYWASQSLSGGSSSQDDDALDALDEIFARGL